MNVSKLINIKSNKAITGTDISIAVIIIIMFVSIITTAYYNYYLTITSKNRSAVATNCIIDVIENVQIMQYENINDESVKLLIKQLYDNKTLPEQYTMKAKVEKYNQTVGNEKKKDLIKKITVTVEYIVGKKTQKLEINKLIIK